MRKLNLEVYLLNSYLIFKDRHVYYSKIIDKIENNDNSLKTIINEDLNEVFISEFKNLRRLGFLEIGINRIIDRIDLLVNPRD